MKYFHPTFVKQIYMCDYICLSKNGITKYLFQKRLSESTICYENLSVISKKNAPMLSAYVINIPQF